MTQLTRLFEASEDPFERTLLSSALEEQPSMSSVEEAALALGLTAATAKALAATLPATAGAASVAGGASSLAPGALSGSTTTTLATGASGATVTSGTASLLFVTKNVVGGALASFLTIGALHQALEPATEEPRVAASTIRQAEPAAQAPPGSSSRQRESAKPPPAEPHAPPPAPAPRQRSRAAHALDAIASQKMVTPPSAPMSASFAVTPAPETSKPSARDASASLAVEIRLLDQARTALANRDFAQAARLLDAYASSRPSGVLTREATLLRVRLLRGQGNKSAAAALARAFALQHPELGDADLRALANDP